MKKHILKTPWVVGAICVTIAYLWTSPNARWHIRNLWLNLVSAQNNGRIELYGQVLDQNGSGVAGVSISGRIQVDDGPYRVHFDNVSEVSDTSGRFHIGGYVGTELVLAVSKADYIVSAAAPRIIDYSSDGRGIRITSDPEHPVIFSVWKVSSAKPLARWAKSLYLIPDGRYYSIDLSAGRVREGKAEGDLWVSILRGNAQAAKYDWSFSCGAVNGGIAPTTDAFLFLAPTEGYEQGYHLDQIVSDPNWKNEVRSKFYLRAGGGSKYVAIEADILPRFNETQAALYLSCWINSAGSRDLEHLP